MTSPALLTFRGEAIGIRAVDEVFVRVRIELFVAVDLDDRFPLGNVTVRHGEMRGVPLCG